MFFTVVGVGCAAATPSAAALTDDPFGSHLLPTETPVPAVTLAVTSTESPRPTLTLTPTMGVIKSGLKVICMPPDYYNPNQSTVLPDMFARGVSSVSNPDDAAMLDVQVPGSYCGYFVTFNYPVPPGTKIEFLQGIDPNPWLEMEMTAVPGDPLTGYVISRHEMLTNPPAWEMFISVKVVTPDEVLRLDAPVHLWRELLPPCANGLLPDPVTQVCP